MDGGIPKASQSSTMFAMSAAKLPPFHLLLLLLLLLLPAVRESLLKRGARTLQKLFVFELKDG